MAVAAAAGWVPRRLIWDNDAGIGCGKRHAEGVGAFTGTLATTLVRLKPYDPESKGLVERRNGFFEISFMPGRDFASPADFDAQFGGLGVWHSYCSGLADRLEGRTVHAVNPSAYFGYTLREPVGVVGAITPWNSPLLLLTFKLAPLLAAGCTCVVKRLPTGSSPVSSPRPARPAWPDPA